MKKLLRITRTSAGSFRIEGLIEENDRLDTLFAIEDGRSRNENINEWVFLTLASFGTVRHILALGDLIVSAKSYMKLVDAELFNENEKIIEVNEPIIIDVG